MKVQEKLAGIALCLLIALPSWYLGKLVPLIGGPVFGILLGMLIALLYHNRAYTQKGIQFTSKYILQAAVVFLGFGLNLSDVIRVGVTSLPIILSTIFTSLLVAFLLYRALKLDADTAILVGVGSSICGGSAIAATAPVIHAKDEDIAKSISVIFFFNIIAAIIFPTIGAFLGMSDQAFGLFAGTAINDTSSVTAAASAWDALHHSNVLEIATIVKLTRTLAIIPITLVLAFYRLHQAKKKGKDAQQSFQLHKAFPTFVLFFVIASIITTFALSMGVPTHVFVPLKTLSKFLIVMAMSAIGLNTDLVKLIKTGGSALILGASCWIAIACVCLTMQAIFY